MLLGTGIIVLTLAGDAQAQGAPNAEAHTETKDRLSPARIQSLAGAEAALAQNGDFSLADAALDKRLHDIRKEHGADSLDEGDTLMAFAVLLYMKGLEAGDIGFQRAARPYLSQSVAIYRAALGPDDPYLAVALNSHADLLLTLNGDVPTPEAEAILQEALKIRMASLGRNNVETLASRNS